MLAKRTVFIHCALIAVLAIIIYSNSLDGKFVLDDYSTVRDNAYIKSWHNIGRIFIYPFGAGDTNLEYGKSFCFYRPIQSFIYMLSYSLFKFRVQSYHCFSIALHILAGIGIYWLISLLFKNQQISLLTSAFFITHPIHTEAINYISGMADPLVFVFILSSFILYIRFSESRGLACYILMLLSYTLALLSKESGLILIPLLLLYHFVFKVRLKRTDFYPLIAITLIYLLGHIYIVKSHFVMIFYLRNIFGRFAHFFGTVTKYLYLLLVPIHLHMEFNRKLLAYNSFYTLLGIAIIVLLIAYLWRSKARNTLACFSIGWFLLTLLPASGIFYPTRFTTAEHYLYIPSMGFFLPVAEKIFLFLERNKTTRNLLHIAVMLLLLSYCYLTIRQNEIWRNPFSLYRNILRYSPKDMVAYNNLALEHYRSGDTKNALHLLNKAITLEPAYEDSYLNLAFIYDRINEEEKAIELYKKVINMNERCGKAYLGLGNAYADVGKHREAFLAYNNALLLHDNDASVYYNLGVAFQEIKRYKNAIRCYKKAIAITPYFFDAYNNLSTIFIYLGRHKDAIAVGEKILHINPEYPLIYCNLSVAYFNEKQYGQAIIYCDQAIALGVEVPVGFRELLRPYR